MANMMDYLYEYGGITLDKMPFTPVDNLILAQLAYGRYDRVEHMLPDTLENIYADAVSDFRAANIELLKACATSKRFKNIVPFAYKSVFSEHETKQFAAITFMLPDGTAYVSYRGTDNTIVGWKEDFNLSFSTPVPAQVEAVNYINFIGDALGCPLRVGGHSKGGNLAMYAAAFCKGSVGREIYDIYNNDGPGFTGKILESAEYSNIVERVRTYIPKSSIVGMLLEQKNDYKIVDSDARGLFQHNPYTWQTSDEDFSYLERTTSFSYCMSASIREWLSEMSIEKRRRMTDALFEILSAGEAKTLREIRNDYRNIPPMVAKVKDMDAEDRNLLLKLAAQFTRISLVQYGQFARDQLSTVLTHISELKSRFSEHEND